ncbi:hypothetical protein Ancab_022889 [Ancistrocladus abbreviatus]
MTSIRRTLSPVPRAGARTNGEACMVASPLSKSSSFVQSNLQPGVTSYSLLNSLEYALYRIHAFALGFFYHRSSRPLERSKPKVQLWKKAILHFAICFVVGIVLGLTPFASMNLSGNIMSKHQTLFFEMIPSVSRYHTTKVVITDTAPIADTGSKNFTLLLEKWNVERNASTEHYQQKPELAAGISDEKVNTKLLSEGPALGTRKLLIIVTPTFTRPFQAYYLNRLAQTLKLVQPPLLWVVVEMINQSAETADILRRTSVMYRHLVCNTNLTDIKDQYDQQKNIALSHIKTHHLDGIVYFADEDRVYSIDLFEQLRQISQFGTWMVAKLSWNGVLLEGPVCNGTEVIGWSTNDVTRRFHADISGFAFNSTLLWGPKRWNQLMLEPISHLDAVKENLMVSTFIEQLVHDETQMEGLLQACSSIMVWHLPLESSFPSYPHQWLMRGNLDFTAPLG